MCGIAGFHLSKNFTDKEKYLKVMNDKISHRGPDGEGFYIDNDICLSHKRLAIIDLNNRSDQPFTDVNKQYVIIFNGEIYNYLELKKTLIEDGFEFKTESDTEVLLNAYIKWDVDVLSKIRGMFAFAIYDKKSKKIFCARDHFGQKPFFYYYKNNNFVFSSELTSLISNPAVKKEICTKSIYNYLHYDSFVYDTTPLKNCYKLAPSQYLIYDITSKKISKKKYWDINIKQEKINYKNSYDLFIDKVVKSTELHLRSDVPIALYLSGGIDSSTLACISKKILRNNNIDAFNLKFKNETFNENILAEDTAEKLQLKLKTFNLEDINFISELENSINKIDEPLADVGYLAVGFISHFVSKENYKVVISGDGGDELLMGYEPFQKYWLYKLLNTSSITSSPIKKISELLPDNFNYMGFSHKLKIFSKALGYPNKYCNSRWIGSFLPEEINKIKSDIDFNEEDNVYSYISKVINGIDSSDELDKLSIQYQKHFLSNLICNHTDKANMQYSIEARSPFLDPDLFDLANSLPTKMKMDKNVSKILLRKFLKQNLSNKTFKTPKKGFTVPLANWLKNELRDLVLDTLSESIVADTGFIKYEYLYNNIIKPHMDNKSNNHKKIWNIFVLVKWLKNNKIL